MPHSEPQPKILSSDPFQQQNLISTQPIDFRSIPIFSQQSTMLVFRNNTSIPTRFVFVVKKYNPPTKTLPSWKDVMELNGLDGQDSPEPQYVLYRLRHLILNVCSGNKVEATRGHLCRLAQLVRLCHCSKYQCWRSKLRTNCNTEHLLQRQREKNLYCLMQRRKQATSSRKKESCMNKQSIGEKNK